MKNGSNLAPPIDGLDSSEENVSISNSSAAIPSLKK